MLSLDVLSRCSLLDLSLLVESWVGLGSSDTGMGRSIGQVRTHKLVVLFVCMACQTTARAFASSTPCIPLLRGDGIPSLMAAWQQVLAP